MINGTSIIDDENEAYWIALITFINTTISQYGLGLIWLMGNIGSIFNCIIFYQPVFRHSPCAMYFIASSLTQIFTFNFALFTRMLQFGYHVQAVNTIVWFCKIRYYLFYIFVAIPRYNIILASIDRYFASSRNVLHRQWSSQKIAFRLIIGNIVFWSLIYVQVIIFYKIENGECLPQTGSYGIFFSVYIVIDSGILPLLLMFIFGLLTVRNVHQTTRRIRPIAMNNHIQPVLVGRMSNKDTQLYHMLASQVLMFIILNIPNPCYLLYRSLTMNIVKSSLRVTVELFINNMTYVFIYLGFALIFITFLISSKMFRGEFLKFIQTKILRRPGLPVVTNGVGIARTNAEVNVPS